MKVVFVDVESTGNGKHINHAIVELTLQYWVGSERVSSLRKVDTLSISIKPQKNWVYQNGKKERINYKRAQKNLENAMAVEEETAYEIIIQWLDARINKYKTSDKALIVGYNVRHDIKLLNNLFKRHKNKYLRSYFHTPGICVQALCTMMCTAKKIAPKSFKQLDVAKALGYKIDYKKLHNPEYDLDLTTQLFFKFHRWISK